MLMLAAVVGRKLFFVLFNMLHVLFDFYTFVYERKICVLCFISAEEVNNVKRSGEAPQSTKMMENP